MGRVVTVEWYITAKALSEAAFNARTQWCKKYVEVAKMFEN